MKNAVNRLRDESENGESQGIHKDFWLMMSVMKFRKSLIKNYKECLRIYGS